MSALDAPRKACLALAEAFAFEANEAANNVPQQVALMMSAAYSRAAESLEARIREECTGDINAGIVQPTKGKRPCPPKPRGN